MLILESEAASTDIHTHVLAGSSKGHLDDTDRLARRTLIQENAVRVGRRIHLRIPKRHEARNVPCPQVLVGTARGPCEGKGRDGLIFGERVAHLKGPHSATGSFAAAVTRSEALDSSFPTISPHDARRHRQPTRLEPVGRQQVEIPRGDQPPRRTLARIGSASPGRHIRDEHLVAHEDHHLRMLLSPEGRSPQLAAHHPQPQRRRRTTAPQRTARRDIRRCVIYPEPTQRGTALTPSSGCH